MQLSFTNHAALRQAERCISKQHVSRCIEHGTVVKSDRKTFKCTGLGISVVVAKNGSVITAFRHTDDRPDDDSHYSRKMRGKALDIAKSLRSRNKKNSRRTLNETITVQYPARYTCAVL